MDCPVCQHKNVNPLQMHCPVCNADLTAFRMVDQIEEEYIEAIKNRVTLEGELARRRQEHTLNLQKNRRRANRLVLLLLCLPFLQLLCGKRPLPPVVEAAPVVSAPDSSAFYQQQWQQANRQIQSLEAQKVKTVRYVIRKGDNLESIGRLFFNDWKAGYQIGRDNKVPNEYQLPIGDTLYINFR